LRLILTRPLLSSEKAQGCPDLASFFSRVEMKVVRELLTG
jgi:hypothetical protein